ncbi:unnamed protein product [Dicrocoelium dendriticum]|nr:unnamed protein product [Dicrocoelium dendriticum]
MIKMRFRLHSLSFIAFAAALVSFYFLVNHGVLQSSVSKQNFVRKSSKSSNTDEAVHIVQLLLGDATVHRSVTMLKSLLFFQHRLQANNVHVNSTSTCFNDTREEYTRVPIHVHVIAERATIPLVRSMYSNWSVRDFYWQLYEMDKYLVLSLDSDTLFHYDVVDLWNHFKKFNATQALALAWEQQSAKSDCSYAQTFPIPPNGLNSGLVLMHLKKLRALHWDKLRDTALREYLQQFHVLHQADQPDRYLLAVDERLSNRQTISVFTCFGFSFHNC